MFQLIEAYYFWEILKRSKESLNIVDFSYVTFFFAEKSANGVSSKNRAKDYPSYSGSSI